MDWATQPDPFRRFEGAPLLPLERVEPGADPPYEVAYAPERVPPAPVGRVSLSRLFHDSLALSAWKQAGASRWALRVNPSSGNLHPTEGYLVTGAVEGLHAAPAVFHYAPHEHGLELRAELPGAAWQEMARQLPDGAVLVGLTSIHWRESWKYGERGFRYCQHDVGHAVAAVAIAAAGLGWRARLLESVPDDALAALLGVKGQTGPEAEHPDCLIAVYPHDRRFDAVAQQQVVVPAALVEALGDARWRGTPNRLSERHHPWPVIDDVSLATVKAVVPGGEFWPAECGGLPLIEPARTGSSAGLREVVHRRRSAVAFDGRVPLGRDAFFRMLTRVMPAPAAVPFATLPWRPCVDLLLFVHRVTDVAPGLYVLLREARRQEALSAALARPHVWERPPGCPADLPVFLLEAGDARGVAQETSCDQEIAADGAFAVALLAEFRAPLEAYGAWFYRRLFWETGAIGQVLYLEAEAAGIRGTGIGCFFDDLTHRLFGLEGDRFQVLYHFTAGGPVDDPRLQTLPPYHHRSQGV
jgi:SagB-type dehydrogenase family enzyme